MLLPHKLREMFFLLLAKIAYSFDKKYRHVVKQNLDFAYDDKLTDTEVLTIKKECYNNLLLNFLQLLENRVMDRSKLAKIVQLEGVDVVEKAQKESRPIIFVSAHFGNWELGVAALSTLVVPTLNIYKKLKNPYFDTYLVSSRARVNVELVEKSGALKHVVKALRSLKPVGFLVDQNTDVKDSLIVDFFGKKVTQTASVVQLAQKYNALIIPLFIHEKDRGSYVLKFEKGIEVDSQADQNQLQHCAQQISDIVESTIKATPHKWFWLHKRFKQFYKEIYL